MDPLSEVLRYHERTKHHLDRYACSLGYLDWENQPDPFRRFEGAPIVPLEEVAGDDGPTFDDVIRGSLRPASLDARFVSRFLLDSLALSAWKEFRGNRWSLRVNPSSGNLHPTEGYLLCGPVKGLTEVGGVFHYSPWLHALERRAELSTHAWSSLSRGLPAGAFLVGLTSIHWREAWKYGERAYRYCQHDVGHAIGALAVAAAVLGWRVQVLEGATDAEVASLLGVRDQVGIEREHPDALLAVYPAGAEVEGLWQWHPSAEALAGISGWIGAPNTLSAEHHDWAIIDEVSQAATKDAPLSGARVTFDARPDELARPAGARAIIRQRRSAVDMDAITSMPRESFFSMLRRTLPAGNPTAFGALPWSPAVHLAIFVHRVNDLSPGLYLLTRNEGASSALRAALRENFSWERPEGCPADLPLWRLVSADAREGAQTVSCHQAIASDGAFALGMLAEFEPRLQVHGSWFYRRLFWECGLIGQVLYLEAEAAGLRATGIGCFFDDAMHSVLGLQDRAFQSLYHFTVGGPVEDTRLRTEPPYRHRQEALRELGLTP